ncbi:MAG: DUF3800 domain-containing protein [Zoogloeaceae bacterium]|nr:DUF3800 domain-containing protein [Zoogloeaceae bacterium]
MHICYLDEAGCTGALPSADTQIQPVFVLGGLFVEAAKVQSMTHKLLALKRRFFPNLLPANAHYHDWMAAEIKGADIRRKARSTSRNDRRFACCLISAGLDILKQHDARMVSRVYVKPIGNPFDGAAVYTSTVQSICAAFQNYLATHGSRGIVIADSRNKGKNANVSHSIFTQRFRAAGDPYPALLEVPTFGHSDNHAGLQMMDFLCSALLFPIAAQVCASAHLTDKTHVSPHYLTLVEKYGHDIKDLQYRYQEEMTGHWRGGITLIDPVNKYNATRLFA